jgi:hypothetical protein
LWIDAFLSRWPGWSSVSRLPVTNDKTDGLSLDGYRVLTFRVQGSNDSSREVRDGEGKINFLFSFSYLQPRPTLYSTDEQSALSSIAHDIYSQCRGYSLWDIWLASGCNSPFFQAYIFPQGTRTSLLFVERSCS